MSGHLARTSPFSWVASLLVLCALGGGQYTPLTQLRCSGFNQLGTCGGGDWVELMHSNHTFDGVSCTSDGNRGYEMKGSRLGYLG